MGRHKCAQKDFKHGFRPFYFFNNVPHKTVDDQALSMYLMEIEQ